MGVGLRLKRILRNRKMTIKQLAENANIPVNTLYSITKRDSERVDPVIPRQLSETLEVPTSVLTGHSAPPDEAAEYAERMTPPEVMEDFKKAAPFIPLGDGSIGLFRIRAETEEETERIRKEFFRITMNPLPSMFGEAYRNQPIRNMVEDIPEKDSEESYFIQACDFISYFAHLYFVTRDQQKPLPNRVANVIDDSFVARVLATLRAGNKINFKASDAGRPFGFVIYQDRRKSATYDAFALSVVQG